MDAPVDGGDPRRGSGDGTGSDDAGSDGSAADGSAVDGGPRRAAVLGHPVSHSLSPVLHRAAYRRLGLTGWRYDAIDVTEDALAGFLDGLDASWAGLSLTMPLKRRALDLVDRATPLAQALEVVNTITFPDGQRVGDNTDVHGIVAALREAGAGRVERGCVVGGGATAASAVAALAELGCREPAVVVRSRARAHAVLEAAARLDVTVELVDWADAPAALGAPVVVSTVPTAGAGSLAEAVTAAPSLGGVLLDVVYDPWPTAPARAWAERGGVVVDGSLMLLHQAVEQVRHMTGRPAPVEAMRAALAAARAGRRDGDLHPG